MSSTKVWTQRSGDSYGVFLKLFTADPFHVAGDNGLHTPDVLDFGTWVLTVVAMLRCYLSLHEAAQLPLELSCKVIVKGVRGFIPFLPGRAFLDQCRNSGVPMVEDPLFMLPPGLGIDSFLPLLVSGPGRSQHEAEAIAANVTGAILQGMGLCFSWVSGETPTDQVPAAFQEVIRAVNEAMYRNLLSGNA